jgi:large subunit ribosomal protein L4
VLVSDDVVFTEGALAEFLVGPPKGRGAEATAREDELDQLGDAVTTLAKVPQTGTSTTAATSTGAATSAAQPAAQSTQQEAAVSETQGNTSSAGEGVSDEEMAAEVQGQTSSDLQAEESFSEEADGAGSDTEAAKDPGSVGE